MDNSTKDQIRDLTKNQQSQALLTRRAAVALLAGAVPLAAGVSFLSRLRAAPAEAALVIGPGSS